MATKIRLDSQTQGKLPANSLYDWDEDISWNKNFAWNTLYVDDANDKIWIWTAAPRDWGKVDIVWWNLLIDWTSIQWWFWGGTLEILRNALYDWWYKYINDWYSAWIWASQWAWYIWFRTAPSWLAWNAVTFTEHMRITNDGNVWIWTTTPTRPLTVVWWDNNETMLLQNNNITKASIARFESNSITTWAVLLVDANNAWFSWNNVVLFRNRNASSTWQVLRVINSWTGRIATFEWAGNVWIWTSTPNDSAKLDITSTEQGFLPPRMTTAQRDAISSPAGWLVIYNTTTKVLNFYNWTTWGAV